MARGAAETRRARVSGRMFGRRLKGGIIGRGGVNAGEDE